MSDMDMNRENGPLGEAHSRPGREEWDGSGPEPEEVVLPKPIINIRCASDGSRAEIEFSRTAAETADPTREDIEAAIEEKGIVFGINEQVIQMLCQQPIYNRPIEFAKSSPPRTGADGHLVYLIRTDRTLRPTERADGTMDYRDLGYTHNVTKGQSLCEVHEPAKGEDGCNIFGVAIEGLFGKTQDVPIGKNTEFDKENGAVISTVDGNAVVSPGGIIDVHDVLRISDSVDNSTGNISFVGDVIIDKDVVSGFKVEAKGDIVVKGTVEGAILTSSGNISVNEGINGMNRAKLIAQGSVKCKYIQNCHIVAGEDIYADSIMYCTIECGGNIELSGKRGALIGGKTIVAKSLVAKAIGTDSHVATNITMAAVGLQHNEKIMALKKQVTDLDTELISLVQTMTWCEDLLKKGKLKPFQEKAYENAKIRQVEILKERPEKLKQLEDTQNELLNVNPEDSFIKCSSHIHTGVRIIFGTQMLHIQTSYVNSRVYLLDGEITVSSL